MTGHYQCTGDGKEKLSKSAAFLECKFTLDYKEGRDCLDQFMQSDCWEWLAGSILSIGDGQKSFEPYSEMVSHTLCVHLSLTLRLHSHHQVLYTRGSGSDTGESGTGAEVIVHQDREGRDPNYHVLSGERDYYTNGIHMMERLVA